MKSMMKPHEKIVNNKELLNIFPKETVINIWWCPKYASERQKKFTLSWRKSLLYRNLRHEKIYTLKGWPPPVVFLKIYLLKRGFFVTFNFIISHNFPENFIEIPQVVQKIWRPSSSIIAAFINFHQVFGFSGISLLQRN